MKPGDSVVVLKDPLLWGTGEIESVKRNGRIEVYFDDTRSTEDFEPHELELLSVWVEGHDLEPERA